MGGNCGRFPPLAPETGFPDIPPLLPGAGNAFIALPICWVSYNMDEKHQFEVGDAVRIMKGILASFYGKVVSVDNKGRRLTLSGKFVNDPVSEPHVLNASFIIVEKLGGAPRGTRLHQRRARRQ